MGLPLSSQGTVPFGRFQESKDLRDAESRADQRSIENSLLDLSSWKKVELFNRKENRTWVIN